MNPNSAIPTPQQPAQQPQAAGNPTDFGDYSDWAAKEMANGASADQLHQVLAQHNISVQPAGGGASAPQTADNAPWWQKIMPTAGGVLGGILGGVADVGSLGALAPLINPITGAALGGAAGQAAENAVQGKNPIQGNDLSSGIENAVGEATGLGASKVIGALGGGIVSAGEKAADKVATAAAEQAASKGVINDAIATQLNYGGISSKLAGELELGKGQDFVKNMGFDATNPYDMQKVASSVGELNNVYDRALQAAPDVDMKNFNTSVFNSLKANGTTDLSTSPVGAALGDFNKVIGADANAAIPESMPATQVRQLQQAVGRQIGNTQTIINNAELNGTYNTEAQSNLKTLQDLYDQLGSKLKTPEVNNAVKDFQVTDADRQGLIAKYGDKLGNHIADTIGNAQNADDLLGPMQDLTKMGQASRMAINDIENVTNSPRAVARAKFQANGGVAPSAAVNGKGNPALDVVEGAAHTLHAPTGMIISAGRKLHEAGVIPQIAKGVGNIIQRTSKIIPPVATAASNIPNLADQSQQGTNLSAIPAPTTGGAAMQPGTMTNPTNSTLETILQSLQQPGASLTPGYSSMVSGAAGLAPKVQGNEMAANTVAGLTPTFANAGGPQGLGGGILSNVLSAVPGTPQNTYTNEQTAAAEQLAKILGISPQAALAMLPKFTQSPGTAAPQQSQIGSLVNSLTAGLQ